MIWMLVAMAQADDPAGEPVELPQSGVVMKLNAYGKHLVGHVIVDAEALGALGMTLAKGDPPQPRSGTRVPLSHDMRVTGTPKGDRLVQNAVDSMLYFDNNEDGYLDAADPAFAALYLFVDADGDGKMVPAEARPLGEIGVESISRFGDIRFKEKWTETR